MPKSSQLAVIEKPIYGGAFLARAEGKALFTPLCLVGEEVQVRAVEEKRSFSVCELEAVIRAAPERIEPRCQHFGLCGGCSYQHTDGATQLGMKVAILKETMDRAGVSVPIEIDVLAGDPWGYRNRIRLAVDEHGKLGYRARRSRQIIPIAECPIAAPVLFRAKEAAERALSKLPNIGVEEIELFANADETELLIRILAKSPVKTMQWLTAFAAAVPGLTGLEMARVQKSSGRTNGSSEVVAHWGKQSLKYQVAGFEYRVDLGAFFQVNRFLVDALVERVTTHAKGKLAWDLYAGVGLFARRLSAHFDEVIAVESASASTRALEENVTGVAVRAVEARTEDFVRRNQNEMKSGARGSSSPKGRAVPDLIVVDPPRAGLGAETVEGLVAIGAPRIVYVSCDPATLARDLKGLTNAGYRVTSLTMADLFPQTYHLESIVHLERS